MIVKQTNKQTKVTLGDISGEKNFRRYFDPIVIDTDA